MNLLEKAEKSLEFLKNSNNTAKSHELQTATGTLGRCLGALASRPNFAKHYTNLLYSAIPTLLALASNDSAEVRLVGDEALNRAVVGGYSYHPNKTNVALQNQIDHTKNARWIRAALSRICLGKGWLKPGVGRIRSQAEMLFPKLGQIVRHSKETQIVIEALESNLPRILDALADYTADEELFDLTKSLLHHVDSKDGPVRRGVATCVGHLCSHKESLITHVLAKVFENLWPHTTENNKVLGWFGVLKAIFQTNDLSKFSEDELFSIQDYLELYQLCIHYIEHSTVEHNVQNAVMECLSVLLSRGGRQRALLERPHGTVNLDHREKRATHTRNVSSVSAITSYISNMSSSMLEEASTQDHTELNFTGALHLGSLSQLQTPMMSVEDLTIHTPDSPPSDVEFGETELNLTQHLTEKLEEIETSHTEEETQADPVQHDNLLKVNIGSSSDEDIPLKYCARLLTTKFLLTGNKNGMIPDRNVRVSVKASALNCLSEILLLYPQAMTMYVDRDADGKCHYISGSTEGTESNQEINDFILERNVCYQDSLTDSIMQELLLKGVDTQSLLLQSKKDSKSESVELKTSKDIPSNILDNKLKNDLVGSKISDSTNPNMTNSNFTMNSNMSASNDPLSTAYPMTSSGGILSSSIDLDMKFDHFGESSTNIDNLESIKDLKTEPIVESKIDECDYREIKDDSFEYQHMSDIFVVLQSHPDPQIRGLVRVCIGNYLSAALDLSHGDYYRWRHFYMLPKEVAVKINTDVLVDLILKGLTDDIHSCVNHTLNSLSKVSTALAISVHSSLLLNILSALVAVETNPYWLCKVSLCRLYERLPYQRLFMLYPGSANRSAIIMDTMYRLLSDEDHKVRGAAASAITVMIPKIYPKAAHNPTSILTDLAKEQSNKFTFDLKRSSLHLVREIYFYNDLPDLLKKRTEVCTNDNLKIIVSELFGRLMESSCRFYSQGLLETLHSVCKSYNPWFHIESYTGFSIMNYCLDSLDCCGGMVPVKTVLLDLCTMLYPVEIHKVMNKRKGKDIFERDTQSKDKWQHLADEKCAKLSEKFLQVTLKMLNILVHLIEEVNPNVHVNKGGIALPGSPVRRKTSELTPKKSVLNDNSDEKSLKRKSQVVAANLRANFVGHFFNEPLYMKLYEDLRATYSNYKINLDSKSTIFHVFLTTVLDALSVQLEFSTDRELGNVTEEILYYLKIIMPLRPDKTVFCVTQLLKCLFSTNMISQYNDFMIIKDVCEESKQKSSFYDDVISINVPVRENNDDSFKRGSVSSISSQKLAIDVKNPVMVAERKFLMHLENFHTSKMDRKWSTNKKELERYIRMFEPVVIQALRSYSMQNDIPFQCYVLGLLNQLLTLRVNYCMLDSDQIFLGYLLKQLELIEQHEIPNCCDLVQNILLFLVQLSSSKHHSKQIIEIPKLIQLCDGLMASGAHSECVSALRPVCVRVFCSMFGSTAGLGRSQQQEAQATKEVLFSMMQKTMHDAKVLDLVTCVLALAQDHPESYYRWSELAVDTLLNLLSHASLDIQSREAICVLERLMDSIYRDVLLEQTRVEKCLKILFQTPPDQVSAPYKSRLQYMVTTLILLRKVFAHIPENEILLSINMLKATSISPQSIFFNVKPDIDPLNVQNVNENCANLSPDVVLVRFLFKTLTYAILEIDKCNELECTDLGEDRKHSLLYCVCVNLICQVKHMLHLKNGCLYPLSSKTAQLLLHNEQSGLNTGLYSPDENIPLDLLNLICLRSAHRVPLLTVHWSHLLIRLNFLEHKFWQNLLGYVRSYPFSSDKFNGNLQVDMLQVGCFMAYCEYFVENGLSSVVHLTWLLISRVRVLISYLHEPVVRTLVLSVQNGASSSGLLLQAISARCQSYLKGEFAFNTYKLLSKCHETQSGTLIFFIARIIGKLESAIAVKYANLAIQRCRALKEMSVEEINGQLSKEDVQVALELLQRNRVHVRYKALVVELNSLASSIFDLSPLDLSHERPINPDNIANTSVDNEWLINQIKSRCASTLNKVEKQLELAAVLSNLSKEDLKAITSNTEFDRKILRSCFKVTTDAYLKEFLNNLADYEGKEIERERLRERRQMVKLKEEMAAPTIDNNILNVATSLHVFKRSDSKESKSQFFIPMKENNKTVREAFGNLEISDNEVYTLNTPDLPVMFTETMAMFEKNLSDILKLFPKQSRPLSQSENFDLNAELTMDKYTRRCHQVFQDKLFYQEFYVLQTVMIGYLESLHRLEGFFDAIDCDVSDKLYKKVLPRTLARNMAIFTVISLQYASFLIKNKKVVESPVHIDVSFRLPVFVENIVVDNVIGMVLSNASKAMKFKDIWTELNQDNNANRVQSAISCLFAITKYLLKDTKPLVLKRYLKTEDENFDMVLSCDKLLTLLEYWEVHFYKVEASSLECGLLPACYKTPVEELIVSLSRLDLVTHIALIPPIEWPSIQIVDKKDISKIDLPLQAFQDMDVLEQFLFRVNFIGWSSKKLFEEIWVGLLGALQGNGTHWAVRGIAQLLVTSVTRCRRDGAGKSLTMHLPRKYEDCTNGINTMRGLVVGTSLYGPLFENVNLERVPLMNEESFEGCHYAQFNTEYLKLAADISDEASFRTKLALKRIRRTTDIDINSCLQLLMDVAAQMLHPKAPTGLSARCALLSCIIGISDLFTESGQWCWLAHQLISLTGPEHKTFTQYSVTSHYMLYGLSKCLSVLDGFEGLTELSTVHQRLLKSLSSSYAPLRQAALQGCLLQLTGKSAAIACMHTNPSPYKELVTKLRDTISLYLNGNQRISVYEQSMYWSVLFTLVQMGHCELLHVAVNFLLDKPTHYCADLIVKGITSVIRQQILPKDHKNSIMEKLLDNSVNYSEKHAMQILMVHLFSANNKLLSPREEDNMDPDILMNAMERITKLYRIMKVAVKRESKHVIANTLKYFLRETLPPAATLSRVVIEFVESCKESDRCSPVVLGDRKLLVQSSVHNAEIVFEVFETAIDQDQLPVLSGWIFEALSHLLGEKLSTTLLPTCLACLLIAASPNKYIRQLAPISFHALRLGFNNFPIEDCNVFQRFVLASCLRPGFMERRLLCTVAMHSDFSTHQLDKLRELCLSNECFEELLNCLSVDGE